MKSMKILVGMCVIALLMVGCVTSEVNVVKESTAIDEMAYKYVDIDPVVIVETWEKSESVVLSQFMFELYYRNPDKKADIQLATILVTPAGVAGYSYMADGKINVFEFNPETNAYESIWEDLPPESQQMFWSDYQTYFGVSGS